MSSVGTPTFDQLKVFLTVVETGSFAGAGRRLHQATSVVSYAIGDLEAQFGLRLCEREGTRKPTFTVAGRALLAEAPPGPADAWLLSASPRTPPMTRNPMLVRISDGIPAKGKAHGHAFVRL